MSGWTEEDFSLPSDPRAESSVINYAQIHPRQIIAFGLTPGDFYIPKHRRLWAAMVAVRLQCRDADDPGGFYVYLLEHLEHEHGKSGALGILESVDDTADWEYDVASPDAPLKGIDQCVAQIQRCVTARRILDAAQQIAERTYRVPAEHFDVSEATALLARIAGDPCQEVLGMELPI